MGNNWSTASEGDQVRNLAGSDIQKKERPNTTAKGYWLETTGAEWPAECSVLGCYSTPILGGHVKDGWGPMDGGQDWWIVPVCKHHNGIGQKLKLKEGAVAAKDEVSHYARAIAWKRDALELRREAGRLERAGQTAKAELTRAAAGLYDLGVALTPGVD